MRYSFYLSISLVGMSCTLAFPQDNAAKDESRAKVDMRLDVEYASVGDTKLKLDLFMPKDAGSKPKPCVVWIHGGGWQKGDKSNGHPKVGRYAASGDYVAASVEYRLTDKAAWPAQIHDCKAAIRYLRAHAGELGIDPDKIGVWGESAGGQLVNMLGTSGDISELEGTLGVTNTSSRVQCVVDFCGPSDFLRLDEDMSPTSVAGAALIKLFEGPLKLKKEVARQASAANYVSKDDPPFLIVHGTADPLVPIDQATSFFELQKKVGMKTSFIKMEGGGHIIFGDEIFQRVRAFFDRELLGKDVPFSDAPIKVK